MNDRDILRTDRASRVQTFGIDNAGDFAPTSKGRELFLKLDPILEKLLRARVGQVRTPVGKKTAISALFADFKDIARTSRSIALEDSGFPASTYRYPSDYTEATATTHSDSLLKLLEDNTAPVAAGGDTPEQLSAKAALRAKFIAFEMDADFVEDLRADRDALDGINRGKHSDNHEGVESTAAIDTLLDEAQDIVTLLDAIMHNKYRGNPDKLHAWKRAARIERAARKTKADAEEADDGSAPVVAPPTP